MNDQPLDSKKWLLKTSGRCSEFFYAINIQNRALKVDMTVNSGLTPLTVKIKILWPFALHTLLANVSNCPT